MQMMLIATVFWDRNEKTFYYNGRAETTKKTSVMAKIEISDHNVLQIQNPSNKQLMKVIM
jgi:hypothetical protein